MQVENVNVWFKVSFPLLELNFLRFFLEWFYSKESNANKCIITGKNGNDLVFLAVFVDDRLLIEENWESLQAIVKEMAETLMIMITVAANLAAKEMWLRTLLNDVGYQCGQATKLCIDNQSTIRLIGNPEFDMRSKHIDIRYPFIIEKYEEGIDE